MAFPSAIRFVLLTVLLCVLSLSVTDAATFKKCSDLPATCECSDTDLTCNNTFGKSTEVFTSFPRLLERITITGNNFTDQLPVNIFGNCSGNSDFHMTELRYLDLSHNNITKLHGKTFHCMVRLETLILNHNNWHVNSHTHVFSSMPKLKRLELENTFFEKLNGTKHLAKLSVYLGVSRMIDLEELNLAGNEFYFMPMETHHALCGLNNLRSLNLSNNKLIHFRICGELQKLRTIDLSNNHLPWLSDPVMENITRLSNNRHLEKVFLDGNLFQCDCGMRNFYNWLKNDSLSVAVQNKQNLKCNMAYNTVDEGRPLMELSLSDLSCGNGHHSKSYNATGIVVGLMFTVIVVMFVVALYYNRVLVKDTWKRWVGKPITLALIPQSQGYSTVDRMGQV